jgi:glycosyltransferase involved in cell wall biosynthesis
MHFDRRKSDGISIGIDARSALCRHPRGEGKTLLRLYQEIGNLRPDWQFVFYGTEKFEEGLPGIGHASVYTFEMPGFRYNIWENLGLPTRALWDRVTMLHCTSSSAPLLSLIPVVMTIHDVIPLVFDDGWTAHEVRRFKRQLAHGIRSAKAIIAVSLQTQTDLLRLFRIDADKVHVIPWGVDQPARQFMPRQELARRLGRPGLLEPFMLALGGTARRKNINRLLQAFSKTAPVVPSTRLVITGLTDGAFVNNLMAHAQALEIADRLELLDYVSEEELDGLYRHAEIFLFVSSYEGFGLPVVEAMARGLPVIASSTSSIPEVAGDAAVFVDPEDSESIERAILDLLRNQSLRTQLHEKALKRAALFTWRQTGLRTIEVFETVLRKQRAAKELG